MKNTSTRQKSSMTNEQYEAFRGELKRMRKANKLTAADVGDLTGYSAQYIYNIENGKRKPNDELAKELAKVFDLNVGDMFISETERFKEECAEAGRKLIMKRIEKGFTINQVAGFLGIPREAYLNYEHGTGILDGDLKTAADKLFATETRVETVEVVKEVIAPCPIGLETISLILDHVAEMSLDVDGKRALFRELSEIKTSMLEAELFG